MSDIDDINKKIGKFTKDLEKGLSTLQPQIHGVMAHIQNATMNMQPKYIKDCTIDGGMAKVILYNDNAIRIEFADKEQGKEFYDKQK